MMFVLKLLGSKAVCNVIIALANELSKRTDNKVDDAIVRELETVLISGFVNGTLPKKR